MSFALSLLLLCSSALADSLLEVTEGIVGRGMPDVPGDELAMAATDAGDWSAAAFEWGKLAGAGSIEARLWQIAAAQYAERPEQARQLTLQAVQTTQGDPRALLMAAWLINEEGAHKDAAKLLRRFPDGSPDAAGAIVLEMRAWAMAEKMRRSLRVRQRAMDAGETDAWFWFEVALQDAWRGEPEALSHMERAVRGENVAPVHYRLLVHHLGQLGRYDEAIAAGAAGMGRFPDDPALGLAVLELCQDPSARAALERLVAGDPSRAQAQALLGTLLIAEERPDAATAHLQAAIDSGEDRPAMYRLLAEAYAAAGQADGAWSTMQAAVDRHRQNPRVWGDLFVLGREQERLADALRISERAWQEGLREGFLVGFSFEAANDLDQLDLALSWSDRGMAIEGMRPDALSMKALALSRMKRNREALAAYEEALRLDPAAPSVLNNLAWFLLDPGEGLAPDPARARELAEKAVANAESPNAAYLDTLAAALWQLGERERALALQRQAVGLEPDNAEIRATLDAYEAASR